ncbi:MAG: hypothetical protein LiPW16_72 [Microgenomates group bacterium LiPW_16]|nr:MAG: hypothetical protein LiPW16_72 [Microgenomates group bacterium LiPW_16]
MSEVVRGLPVEGKIVGEIGEIQVDTEDDHSRFPFLRYFVDPHIPRFSVVKIPKDQIGEDDLNKNLFKLKRPTRLHGRSFEVVLTEKSPGVIWSDENGILFGTVNIKGNNLDAPYVQADRFSPAGFRVVGLQDGDVLERIIAASRLLRKKGIETEKVEVVIKPHNLIIGSRKMGMGEFKKWLIAKAETDSYERSRIERRTLPKVEKYIENSDFYFTVRGMQVMERPHDLGMVRNENGFKEILVRVFAFINVREKIEAQKEGREVQLLNVEKEEDINYYFTDYLPQRLAVNIAKIHNAGLAHGFLNGHNVSLVGSIYDLDSINGEPLGDEVITIAEMRQDLFDALGAMGTVVDRRLSPAKFSYFVRSGLAKIFIPKFCKRFVETYLENVDVKLNRVSSLEDAENAYLADFERRIHGGKKIDLGPQAVLLELKRILVKKPESFEIRDAYYLEGSFRNFLWSTMERYYRQFIPRRALLFLRLGIAPIKSIEEGLQNAVEKRVKQILQRAGPAFYQNLKDKILNQVEAMEPVVPS